MTDTPNVFDTVGCRRHALLVARAALDALLRVHGDGDHRALDAALHDAQVATEDALALCERERDALYEAHVEREEGGYAEQVRRDYYAGVGAV